MKNNISPKNEKLFLLIWFAINLIVGVLIVHDFGIGTDEPIYILYANKSLDAYKSFFGLLYEPAFEVKNLHYYGPAFVAIISLITRLMSRIMPNILSIDIWHYSYFLLFQLTGLCLYTMTKRWFSSWTAWAVLVLFTTQPLIWGHSFINPKDIPFMFFFTLSIYLGFRLADSIEIKSSVVSLKKPLRNLEERWKLVSLNKRVKFFRLFKITTIVIVFLGIIAPIFIKIIIAFFYSSGNDSWAGKFFFNFATQATLVPMEAYISKAHKLFYRLEYGLVTLTLIASLFYFALLVAKVSQNSIKRYKLSFFFQKNSLSLKKTDSRLFIRQIIRNLASWKVALAGVILGYTISIRVLGPLAGIIVILYLLMKASQKSFPLIIAYLFWASITTYLTWPYLWNAPFTHFFESLSMMSNFPWGGNVLFNGVFYRANNLPSAYLPVLFNIQLTEPFLLLFYTGFALFIWHLFTAEVQSDFLLFFMLGFLLIIFVLININSALYDNFRQLLFALPAMFVVICFSFEYVFSKVERSWVRILLIIALALPGVYSSVKLHPYEYIYYNSLIGGTEGAFRRFEMDYWRTSYRELALEVNHIADYEAKIAIIGDSTFLPYAREDLIITRNKDANLEETGGYAVLTSRWNSDLLYPEAQIIKSVERDGAIFSVLKYAGQK